MAEYKPFKLLAFSEIGTVQFDYDRGVIRVSDKVLDEIGKRNSLVKITGENGKSLYRIVRSRFGEKGLADVELAMQYEDQLTFGILIKKEGERHKFKIERAGVCGYVSYFFTIPSPVARLQNIFAAILCFLSALLGTLIGNVFSSFFAELCSAS